MKSKAKLASEFLNNLTDVGGVICQTRLNLTGEADTATGASHYFVETASDGFIRPKTIANIRSEIVTKAAILSADPYYFSSGVGTSGITLNTNYALFPSANDTITLGVGTYKFSMQVYVTVATSTVSGTLSLNVRGGGTASGTYQGFAWGAITNGGAPQQRGIGSTSLGTASVVTAASAVAGRVYNVVFEGTINVTIAGTFIPSYSFSATLTNGVVTLNALNNIVIEKIAETSITNSGGWV